MKVITAIVLTFLATLALVSLVLAGVAWAGTVNVAATAGYVPGLEWYFSTLSERSIQRHAAEAVEAGEIQVPTEVTQEMVLSGASHYGAMCVPCHGGPGVPRGEFGEGQKPKPPELSHVAQEFSSAEIYWVLQHGIRHTGMPAFGATHSPEELWGLVAFVEQLDGMAPTEYQRITRRAGDAHAHGDGHGQGGDGHGHGGDGHAHGGEAAGEQAAGAQGAGQQGAGQQGAGQQGAGQQGAQQQPAGAPPTATGEPEPAEEPTAEEPADEGHQHDDGHEHDDGHDHSP